MKKLLLYSCTAALLSGCTSQVPLEMEADILTAQIEGVPLIRPVVLTNNSVKFYTNSSEQYFAPTFTLSKGASISPSSGTKLDFSSPQKYVVRSEDTQWQKTYTIEIVRQSSLTQWHFDFEHTQALDAQLRYHVFYQPTPEGKIEWASGNAGFAFTAADKPAHLYPTAQSTNGYKGKALQLTTQSTGELGKLMNSPIAAGNLFLGNFAIDLTNPAKSSRFGIPFKAVPKVLKGYYQYQAGAEYQEQGKVIAGKKDSFDIYAVLFATDAVTPHLDGTNVLTHPNIALMARIKEPAESTSWQAFSLPFEEIKPIDAQKLADGQYSLAIVFSSSRGGGQFHGAVGSTLLIDEVELEF